MLRVTNLQVSAKYMYLITSVVTFHVHLYENTVLLNKFCNLNLVNRIQVKSTQIITIYLWL